KPENENEEALHE
uniref:Skin secreted peptide P4-1 n=1 Tax=Phasmahyla jandaia TaxID=762504 RepID=SSP41_PHAJA|nr:RecName: Full=Skin secreted peptide P4-1; Short=PjP4-1 [Phasmahyla jandaia]